ncbi:hypothetical protein AKO1_011303 [Acrasis kona]|uniref:Uncharacterized protein n=1 Tax=Acrasis kona TaxID=1008807 RepID=A0AAW2YXY8_9EUKA
MKFIVLALIALIAFAVAQHQHCIEHSFTVTSLLLVPSKRYDDEHNIYFDADNQRQRLDVHEFEPEEKHFTIIDRYDLKKSFLIDSVAKTCTVHPLSGELEPYCLNDNAKHVGTLSLGGQLKCDIYTQEAFGFDTRYVLASHSDIPINIFSKGVAHHDTAASIQEWYNYQHGIKDASVFDVPPECNKQNARMVKADSEAARIFKKANVIKRAYMKM